MKLGIHTDIASFGYPTRLDYVLDFINQHPLKPESLSFFLTNKIESASILYGLSDPGKISIKKADFLFNQKKPTDFQLSKHRWQKQLFYSIGAFESNDLIQSKYIPFDLFETIFFFLSRIEELHYPFSAYVGRKELFESKLIGIKKDINHIPVVDHLVLLFLELVTQQKIQEKTTISISHDIDSIRKYNSPYSFLRKMGGQLLHRKNTSRWTTIWKQAKKSPQEDPFDTSNWMLSSKEDQSKEIYFLCGGNHKEDHPYSLNDPIFIQYLSRAIERGYEIGIHPSYDSWYKKGLILQEKNKLETILGKPVSISRQHFLNFDIQCTPGLLESCGILKDSSIGFSRHVGFRSGTGFDHYLYDFEKECPTIIETPLVFMDVAGMHHCHWDGIRFVDLQKSFLAENVYNTHITFLYHNTIFDEMEMRGFDLKPYYHNLISNDRQ